VEARGRAESPTCTRICSGDHAGKGLDSGRHTRRTIPPRTSAQPAAVKAWQQLDGHIAAIDAVGRAAAQLGCRTGHFSQIEVYSLADNFRLDDRALFCTDGQLIADSTVFHRPDQGHRTSPWFRLALKLHSVDSARERYRIFASAEWQRQHPNPVIQRQTADGGVEELTLKNPYGAKASAKGLPMAPWGGCPLPPFGSHAPGGFILQR
jgi:hypothetical protein